MSTRSTYYLCCLTQFMSISKVLFIDGHRLLGIQHGKAANHVDLPENELPPHLLADHSVSNMAQS